MAVNVEPQVIENSVPVEASLSESPIIDGLNERIANNKEPLTFAAVNADFEYLDRKQHFEKMATAIPPALDGGLRLRKA